MAKNIVATCSGSANLTLAEIADICLNTVLANRMVSEPCRGAKSREQHDLVLAVPPSPVLNEHTI